MTMINLATLLGLGAGTAAPAAARTGAPDIFASLLTSATMPMPVMPVVSLPQASFDAPATSASAVPMAVATPNVAARPPIAAPVPASEVSTAEDAHVADKATPAGDGIPAATADLTSAPIIVPVIVATPASTPVSHTRPEVAAVTIEGARPTSVAAVPMADAIASPAPTGDHQRTAAPMLPSDHRHFAGESRGPTIAHAPATPQETQTSPPVSREQPTPPVFPGSRLQPIGVAAPRPDVRAPDALRPQGLQETAEAGSVVAAAPQAIRAADAAPPVPVTLGSGAIVLASNDAAVPTMAPAVAPIEAPIIVPDAAVAVPRPPVGSSIAPVASAVREAMALLSDGTLPTPAAAAGQATTPRQMAPRIDRPALQAVAAPVRSARTVTPHAIENAGSEPKGVSTDPALPLAVPVDPAGLVSGVSRVVEAAVGNAAAPIEQAVDRQLDLARDSAWLDRLARDIVVSAGNDKQLRFQLNPEHLGSLHVEMTQRDDGFSLRMTTETEAARGAIADAAGRLMAEARAQGVRISETHVELQAAGGGNGQAANQGLGGQHAGQSGSGGQPREQRMFGGQAAEAGERAPKRSAANERFA